MEPASITPGHQAIAGLIVKKKKRINQREKRHIIILKKEKRNEKINTILSPPSQVVPLPFWNNPGDPPVWF
jgi:hypothetical protein